MRTIEAHVQGDLCAGYFAETPDDLRTFMEWVDARALAGDVVACDSETTGLNIYTPEFRVRLVQFGTSREGWLIPVEYGYPFDRAVSVALHKLPRLTIQNAPFDGLAFDRVGLCPLDVTLFKTVDTKILAHLIDSRPPQEGGVGTSLKPLAVHYVDPDADDGQRVLQMEFRRIGHTVTTGWAAIDVTHPEYLRYALLDVVLLSRLRPILQDRLREMGVRQALLDFEHEQAYIGAVIQRKGMRLDVAYTSQLRDTLTREAEEYAAMARQYGVTSVNAPKQVGAALLGMGEELSAKTANGQLAVGKEVLLPMADLDKDWHRIGGREPNPLADAVLRSKRAGKWAVSYCAAMLDAMDSGGRIHPMINTLGARTARWSVSAPPLQQLPSSEWRIRRCIIADNPGDVIVASDFAQVELRVLAALAGASRVVERINAGEDLHSLVTRMVFPETAAMTDAELKNDKRRKLCKTISLGKAYAGGINTLARQTGLPVQQVKTAVQAYDRAIPEFGRWSKRLTREAYNHGMTITTPSGRILRLTRDKAYTAIAFMCQSSARDILGEALLNMQDAGLLRYVIGVVHDEVIASVPRKDAEEVSREMGRCMNMPFYGVNIESDPEIYGPTWGHGYAKKGAASPIAATMEGAA